MPFPNLNLQMICLRHSASRLGHATDAYLKGISMRDVASVL
jgi:hypothetical protein